MPAVYVWKVCFPTALLVLDAYVRLERAAVLLTPELMEYELWWKTSLWRYMQGGAWSDWVAVLDVLQELLLFT